MPAMKSTGPLKDNYVSGLEKAVASKVKGAVQTASDAAGYLSGSARKAARQVMGRVPIMPMGRRVSNSLPMKKLK